MCSDRLPIFKIEAHHFADYWFALLIYPEEKILESLPEVMTRFGMISPPQEHIIMVAENFLYMVRCTLAEGEEE